MSTRAAQESRSSLRCSGPLRRTVHYVDVGGGNQVALHEVDEGQAAEKRPVVVLCHGLTYSSLPVWDTPVEGASFCERLAARGYRVYMPDYVGYGLSVHVSGAIDLSSATRDLGATVRAIREMGTCGAPGLLGWSWGAQVVGNFAALTPAGAGAVALYGLTWRLAMDAGSDAEAERRVNNAEHVASDFVCAATAIPQVVDAYVRKALEIDPTSPNGPRREIIAKRCFLHPERITSPTLIVNGHSDFERRTADGLDFFSHLAATYKQFSVVYGAHPLHLERNHVQFLDALDGFFSMHLCREP